MGTSLLLPTLLPCLLDCGCEIWQNEDPYYRSSCQHSQGCNPCVEREA